jgi:hypothetical protein
MSDGPENDAFKLFQRLEEAAKALDKSAATLNGMITGDVMTALRSARSTTADAAQKLDAASAATVRLNTAVSAVGEATQTAKAAADALPLQQSVVLLVGLILGLALAGSILFTAETFWPSSSRESIQNAVLTRIAATTETCQNTRALLGTAAIWVKNNEGRKIVACGFTIINQPPPTPEPEPAPTSQNPTRK